MAELTIPEEYEHGFVEIRHLEEDEVRELVSVLEDEPPTLNRIDLQKRVEERVSPDLLSKLNSIMETLFSLYALRNSMEDLALPEFAEVVSEMMNESYIEELGFTDQEDRERFETKLIQLLGIESLEIATRATDIMYERERTIHGRPRVFTDIRPVFGADPETSPRGGVIVHTLKISYHEGTRVRELFIGMDTENIDELIGILERATLKAKTLKEFLGDRYIEAR